MNEYKRRSRTIDWVQCIDSALFFTSIYKNHFSCLKRKMFTSSSLKPSVGAGWLMLLVSGCFFISPVRSQFGFFGPLLPPSTIYNISTSTVSLTVGTICYIPVTANITQCRRRRGIEEQPNYIVDGITGNILPSQVLRYSNKLSFLLWDGSFFRLIFSNS